MAEIRIEDLHKSFGDFVAVKGSSFTIADGEFFVMLGPSGCGKTTTLRMIAGLELPSSGRILLDEEEVTFNRAAERDIAFVFQLFALYPHMNVRQNIGFPLKCENIPRGEIRRRVEETARLLRIDHLLKKPVSGLAGGDRQRVALGRAIVRRPKAFLMDEPLGALDAEFRELMCQELRQLHDSIEATTVYVTHDQLEAMSMADKIVVMNHGVVEQFGPPQEIYDQPATMFVADFIGSPSMNLLPFEGAVSADGRHVTMNGSTLELPLLAEAPSSRTLTLGVRPEHIRLSQDGSLRGKVFGTEYLGTTQIVTLESDYGPVKARVSSAIKANPGETLGMSFISDRLSLFDSESGQALRTQAQEGAAHV